MAADPNRSALAQIDTRRKLITNLRRAGHAKASAVAVEVHEAFSTSRAGGAVWAAAVDVGFAAVLPVVGALIRDALQRVGVARGVGAIGIEEAHLPDCAASADAAAAIETGFGPVLLLIPALGAGDTRARCGDTLVARRARESGRAVRVL